jgi:hypothetical protein
VESNWVHSSRRPPIGLVYLSLVIMRIENLVEWWLAREAEVLGENLPQSLFDHHKSRMTWQGANPERHGGKPATNRLSYGTVFNIYISDGHYLLISRIVLVGGWGERRTINADDD